MERINVDVSDLCLWETNPRVEPSIDQMDELNKIYNFSAQSQSTSKRQLMNLASSIAENGYQNDVEPILATRAGDKYVIHDANRRLSAIKLLQNPDCYRELLDDRDYKRLKNLVAEYPQNIPSSLDIVVFGDDEQDELREILNRKHNGPQDGAGTIPWSTEAKARFSGKQTFSDKLETPFQNQFGDSLTSYLGGSNATTSTRRVFNSAPVKEYLDIKNPDIITPEQLDKVKELADEVKGYCQENGTLISRLKNDVIKQDIIIPLQEKGQGTVRSPRLAAKRLNHDFASKFATNRDRHLGAMYNNPEWMTDAPEFEDTNFMLSALNAYGVLEDDSTKRWAKAFLIAPAIRVIFELSLLALDKSCNEIHLPNIGVSAKHKENVSYVHRLFKNNKFQDYLQAGRIVFDTYQEAHSVIENTDFGESVEYSSLGSHKSMKDYDIDTIMRLSNDAVLFAMLCQQYVQFKKQGV